jgi:hypothetical protein
MSIELMISKITIDPTIQTRARINDAIVKEYAAELMAGSTFPSVVIFDDGNTKYLADGFHRLAAAKHVGRDRFAVDIRQGRKQDALMYSLKANAEHGLRRTNEDKRHAVELLLDEFEYSDASDREIAQLCAVTHPFVAKIRAGLGKPVNLNKFTPKKNTHNWTRDRSENMETFPPQLKEEEIYPPHEIIKDLVQENEDLKDRIGINAMDATEEEKAIAKETIDSLREENRLLTIERNSLTISRDTYMNKSAEAIRQCNRLQHVLKKLNKQIVELQAKLNSQSPVEEPLPF